mmetsp:Transcript_462/g.1136  ORF Transcript_462/g.1136 Transcript_462/m.1136 type:complete len:591 (+) Transcript_462:74-1846(+)
MLGHAPPVPVNRLRSSFHGCLTARSVRCRPDLKSSRQQNRKPHAAIASSNSQGAAQDPREIAQGFVHNWFKYLARKSPQERRELEKYCGATIRLVPDSALVPQTADIQGVDEVLQHLPAQHASYSKENHKIHAAAASAPRATVSSGTTVFVLVEFALKDTAATPQHPATFRVSQGFGIFRLEVDGSLVQHVELKRQLTHEEVDGILLDSIHVYPAPFPLHELQEGRDRQGQQYQDVQDQERQKDEQRKAITAVAKQWVDAHAAEADLSALDSLMSQDSRLFEAYGILLPTFPALPSPPHCAATEEQPTALSSNMSSNPDAHHFSVRSALGQLHNRSRFIPGSQVRSLLQVLQSSYNILELRDVAIAVDDSANLAFASWSSTVQNKCSAQTFKVREMHAISLAPPDLSCASEARPPQWKLRSIWALRDPYDFERAMLLRPKQQQVETPKPPGGADLYADLVAGLPSPQDIISAVQHKVGAVEGLPWGVIAQSLGEVASAFSAASAAAAARAQGSASERAQGSAAKHANAVLSKKGDSGKQGASAAAAVKEADSAAGVGKERPGNKSATFTVGGQESKSLEEEKEEQAGRDK